VITVLNQLSIGVKEDSPFPVLKLRNLRMNSTNLRIILKKICTREVVMDQVPQEAAKNKIIRLIMGINHSSLPKVM
jgi:hypothetical protein